MFELLFAVATFLGYDREMVFFAQMHASGGHVRWEPDISDFDLAEAASEVWTLGLPHIAEVRIRGESHFECPLASPSLLAWPPSVQVMDFWFFPGNDDQLARLLAGLPYQVYSVSLRFSGVGDKSLDALVRSPAGKRIEVLDVGCSGITSRGLNNLPDLPRLSRLYCPITKVDDAALDGLQQLKGLRELSVGGTRVTGNGLVEHRELLKRLRYLDVAGIRSIGDDEVRAVVAVASNLEILDLTYTSITTASLKDLLSLPKLKKLILGDTEVRLDQLQNVNELPEFGSVEVWIDRSGIGSVPVTDTWGSLNLPRGTLNIVVVGSEVGVYNPENIDRWTNRRRQDGDQ